ncbi:G protein-coupled glucose receptor regulating Gpa2 [Teratosphaeria destructans]|uniref:G protein-coupled glucose receptor regulating Gpa2 n=1 Tax=Teratosphaeria destructans TaxID=418781 RepID=A0A9W7SYK2_9PEZI|nr:G protein-coupled glucose receptor regulating Gpa2 [Teratosphaeria destructans]
MPTADPKGRTMNPHPVVDHSATLTPLPLVLRQGLPAVAGFSLLSLSLAAPLFLRLAWQLATWKRPAKVNQFIILIFNLLLADIHQAIAFSLNITWLIQDGVMSNTYTCRAQGWLLSTGDLACGLFTFAIAVHAFADITFNYRLGRGSFLVAVTGLWIIDYVFALIGLCLHPHDYYVRNGAWCWVNLKYVDLRLWVSAHPIRSVLHVLGHWLILNLWLSKLQYFWVILFEFGTVFLYGLTFVILRSRIATGFYAMTPSLQRNAQTAAKLMICYPAIYVFCTLPLIIARLSGIRGAKTTLQELVVVGAILVSNGWLDVLVYAITRRALASGEDLPTEHHGTLETFRLCPGGHFGTTTTCEGLNSHHNRFIWVCDGADQRKHESIGESIEAGRVRVTRGVDVWSELDRLPRHISRLAHIYPVRNESDMTKDAVEELSLRFFTNHPSSMDGEDQIAP